MDLEYREYAPSPPVASHVACYWTLRGRSVAAPVIPDGHPEVVWNFADPFLRLRPGAAARRQAASLVVGQITTPFLLQPVGAIDLLAIRFRPAAFGAFLGGVGADELVDLDVAVADVLGRRLASLAERAGEAASAAARVMLLDAALAADLRDAVPVDARVSEAVRIITAACGIARIDDIAARAGVGVRQLERLFLSDVGIGPKRFARITRFQALLADLRSTGRSGWSRAAARFGYYDQAHLIREFREFTGGAPGAFMLDGTTSLTDVFLGEP